MHTRFKHNIIAASLTLFMLLTACSSQETQKENFGGFLTNYDQLREMESTDGVKMLGWRAPGLSLQNYHAILIEPVVLSPRADIGERIDADELKDLLVSLRQKMSQQLSRVIKVTDTAGPGVIVYSIAISGAAAVDRDLRWFEYTPITFTASQIAAASGTRDSVVELWVEARWTDGDTGELLATAVRMGQSTEGVSTDEPVDAEHADSLLDQWAASSRVSLERLQE